jgi:hypothetical protein
VRWEAVGRVGTKGRSQVNERHNRNPKNVLLQGVARGGLLTTLKVFR